MKKYILFASIFGFCAMTYGMTNDEGHMATKKRINRSTSTPTTHVRQLQETETPPTQENLSTRIITITYELIPSEILREIEAAKVIQKAFRKHREKKRDAYIQQCMDRKKEFEAIFEGSFPIQLAPVNASSHVSIASPVVPQIDENRFEEAEVFAAPRLTFRKRLSNFWHRFWNTRSSTVNPSSAGL